MAYQTKVPDSDARQWYRGGFRSVALPTIYIVDKNVRGSLTSKDGNSGTPEQAWEKIGFFTSNISATRFQLKELQKDPDYQEQVKNGFYASNKDSEDAIIEEMAGNMKATPADEAVKREIYNTYYKKEGNDSTVRVGGEDPNASQMQHEYKTVDKGNAALINGDMIERTVDDTSLGGNDAINCYWSYNEDDDIVHPQTAYNRSVADNTGCKLQGMGRVYSENINRYQQILFMNFGLPVYKGSIMSMFGGSSARARLINKGNTISASAGNLVGTIFSVALAIPLLPLYGLMALTDLFNDYPVSKYFEHRTAMPLYYKFCNILIGHMAVNLGLYRATEDALKDLKQMGHNLWAGVKTVTSFGTIPYNPEKAEDVNKKKSDNSLLPTAKYLYDKTNVGVPAILRNGPDMLAIMYERSRRLRLFNKILQNDPSMSEDRFRTTDATLKDWIDNSQVPHEQEYMDTITMIQQYQHQVSKLKADDATKNKSKISELESKVAELQKKIEGYKNEAAGYNGALSRWGKGQTWSNLFGMMDNSGLQLIDYIGFRVEKSTGVSETVSNTTGPMEIAGQINGMAQQSMNRDSSIMGSFRNMTGVKQVWDFAEGFISNIADTLGAGNAFNVVCGNGFSDIPERWQSSSFSRSYSVELQLRARYGDPVSWLQSVGIPLACILAGGMPRGIGGSMYTSPFLVRCYCKGMFSIPTGIIESISMTRGGSEFGWTVSRLPLAIDVNITLKDLSPILYIGIDNDMNASMDEYMSTLTGLGLYERTFIFTRWMRRMNRALLLKRNTIANPLWWGNNMGNTGIVRAIMTFRSPWDRTKNI